MDVEEVNEVTAGERLRAAREAKGLTLEDVAAQTRIPRRHLESLEVGDWERLPAPTYTIGFAKSYATVVGLDRTEIGDLLRTELGGSRPAVASSPEIFQPADPARTMPKGLVIGAIVAVALLVLLMSWFNSRTLEGPDGEPAATGAEAPVDPAPQAAAPAPAANQGPVVLTATAPAWVQVTDQGRTLFEGEMATGQTFQVPPTATAPMLRVGAPEALRITVGTSAVPPVGPAGQVTSNVSLRAADLLGARPAAPGAPPAAPPPTAG